MVSTSGVAGARRVPLMASARSLPARISGTDEEVSTKATRTMPPCMSFRICGTVLYGTCRMRMPVCIFRASMVRWPPDPMPHDA
ncbi:hypothetical protein D3C72_1672110 [compost metagenome]